MTATSPQISKLDFAQEARRRGARVYPLMQNSDEPAFPEADCWATTDESQLLEWWHEDSDRNIGISAEDTLIIRITERCPQHTVHEFAALLKANAVPLTFRTVRNEYDTSLLEICLFYKLPTGATVSTGEDVFGPGIDVLSTDDVVLGPGSKLPRRGKCEFYGNSAMADASPWLMKMCGVQLPESNSMNNVIPMKKFAGPPAVAAPKTKFEWVKEAVARLHIDIFPVRGYVDPGPNSTPEERLAAAKAAKTPLIKDWQNEATQDLAKLEAWWQEYPDANIGGATQNHIVVDIDPRNGGEATFAGLVDLGFEFPGTATTRTQSGGQHLIYVAPDGPVKGGTSKLGPGIDIKARGGYVLLPGSSIEGRIYDRETVRPPVFAPSWLVEQCKAARTKTDAAGKRIVEEDDTARELFERWMLKHAPMAYDGEIDDTTYKMCARGYDFGCSQATVYEVVSEWDQTHCFPQNDPDRLLVVVESAGRNRENAIGSSHPLAPGFEVVEIAERAAPAPRKIETIGSSTKTALKAVPLAPFVPADIPVRPWIIPGFACRGRVTMLAGPGGVSKSTYYLMVAVAVASGRNDICGYAVPKPDRVWVWNQEDDLQEMQRRIAAIMHAFEVSWDDLTDENGELRLFVSSGVETPLILATRRDYGVIATAQVGEIIAEVQANKIGTLILDPLVEFHEASENDNVQMRAVVGQVRRIAQEGNCATLLATHTRKPSQASSDGFAGEMDAARGASAQLGVVRVGATIFGMSPKDAKAYQLPAGKTCRDFVRLDIAKNNLAPVLPEPIWFQREGVMIGGGFERNGESVGLLRPVTLVKKVGDKTTSAAPHLPTVLASIIANKLSRERWWKLSDVLAAGAPEQRALFGTAKHRAALIDSAFDGNIECTTDSGKLARTESAPGKPTTLRLGPTSPPPIERENVGGEVENASKSAS